MAGRAEPEKLVELEKVPDPEAGVPPPEAAAPPSRPPMAGGFCFLVDVALRVLFFASTLTAVVVMVTANQTNPVSAPGPGLRAEAKFDNSPALIYFVTALSVACLYSLISALASISVILAPIFAKDFLLFFVICDVVILGIIASATGAAGTVGYIGLKGDSHVNWGVVCKVYDTFCQHIGAASAVSLFAAVILAVLIVLSVVNLHKKIPK